MTLTLGEAASCGKVAASPLALAIKPKTQVLSLVTKMQYFDVLTSHAWVGSGARHWYFVTTVRAANESSACAIAKGRMLRYLGNRNRKVLGTVVHGAAECGAYDGFIGRFVGQFIDEALCQK